MKKFIFLSIMMLSFIPAKCNINNNSGNTIKTEDISITFSGIHFSKAVNNAEKYCNFNDSTLIVDGITGTNYFIAPDGSRSEATAPILLTEIDNEKSFTFTTRLDSKIEKVYDAGTVYIYIDNENWLKFAFERDEKNRCRAVTVRTEGSSDDNNHDIIEQSYVYLRISSNTKQIGYYYSLDGINWNLARIYKNKYPSKIWLGISSQSPKQGNNIVSFRNMSLINSYISNSRLGK